MLHSYHISAMNNRCVLNFKFQIFQITVATCNYKIFESTK